MKRRRYTNEFKVGVFVLLSLFAFFYMIYRTGKIDIKRKQGYYLYVVFDEIVGLEKSSPVMLNGVEVGRVEDTQLIYAGDDTKVKVKIWLEDGAKIKGEPRISIKTLGLMGEKYVQIKSGKGGVIKPNSVLKGEPFVDLDKLMRMGNDLGLEVKKLLVKVDLLINEVKGLTANLNYTVENNKDKVSRIMDNLENTSQNLDEFSEDIKRHPWKLLFRTREDKIKEHKD